MKLNHAALVLFSCCLVNVPVLVAGDGVGLSGPSEIGVAGAPTNAPPRAANAPEGASEFAKGRVLVKFKGRVKEGALDGQALEAIGKIRGEVIKVFNSVGVAVIGTPLGVGEAVEILYRTGAVEYAEPDFKVKTNSTIPNDTYFNELWGLHNTGQTGGTVDADMDAPWGWDFRTSSTRVIVGVVDTGVDYTHEDLRLNMWKNPGEIAGDGIDNDGNGYIDDVYGIDAFNNDSDPVDDHGHGTHVSGTIGGRGNNNKGVVGVSWYARIMALKFLGAEGYGYTSGAIEAIQYALDIKAANNYPRMVLNNSWGGGGYSQALYDVIDLARQNDVLFIAAAGNSSMDTDKYPTYPQGYDLENIISVGASDHNDNPAYFSNFGCSSVDVFAPGESILSTLPSNTYGTYSGTSMATPHVSGMAALLWSYRPTYSWKAIKSAILTSVYGKGQKPQFKGLSVSQGRVNLYRGMKYDPTYKVPSVWGVVPASAQPGDTINIQGYRFGSVPGVVKVNGKAATIITWGNEHIEAVIDQTTPFGQGKVVVTKANGQEGEVGGCFKVTNEPSLVGNTILPHAWASGAKIGNNFWVMSGGTYWGQTGLVEKIDLSTAHSVIDSSWMIPVEATNTGSAAIGSKIYVVGGLDWNSGEVLDDLQIFDASTETWSSGADLPQPLYQASVASVMGKLIVVGGIDSSGNVVNTTYIYDPTADTWSTGANKPTAVAYAPVAPSSTTAWFAGGFSSPYCGSEVSVVEQYKVTTDTWVTRPALNEVRAGSAGAYFAKPYVYGGNCGTPSASGEFYSSGAWHIGVLGSDRLYTPMGAADGNHMYVIGGYSFDLYSMSNRIYKISE